MVNVPAGTTATPSTPYPLQLDPSGVHELSKMPDAIAGWPLIVCPFSL
jgi:hypothetical protein